MLIGAHVSGAGGLPKAIERGVERGCAAIQIFNQSPRAWKPTDYPEEDFLEFRRAMAASTVEAVVIHAAYLVNCASDNAEIRAKSLGALIHSLRVGAKIGADGVIVHPGSAKDGEVPGAIARAGEAISQVLDESEDCPLHLENTAGAGGTLGRSVEELAALIEAAGGDRRLGICLDSCHLLASGYDIRTPAGIDAVLDLVSARIGLERLSSLHLNDSQMGLGSHRDRHANVGRGELGERGCAAFLAAPAFQGLPCVLETPGEEHDGPGREEVELAVRLHRRGLAVRKRSRGSRSSRKSASTGHGGGKRR